MSDQITVALAANLAVRAYAITAKELVEEARRIHHTTPVATAALGRTLCAASLMGFMLKDESQSLTLRIGGDGPLGTILAVSDFRGNVRGYVQNPGVQLPLREQDGKLDVGRAVGTGSLTVIKDLGMKEPYVGSCNLISGEIAEDITGYYALSEQTATVCALGVLVDRDQTVLQAGGYLLQLMPGTEEEIITEIERNLQATASITTLLQQGMSGEDVLRAVLTGFDIEILEKQPVAYRCGCTQERVNRALISLGESELLDILNSQGESTIECQFCDKVYHYDQLQLGKLVERASAAKVKRSHSPTKEKK